MLHNANTRKVFYGLSTLVTGLLVTLAAFNVIDTKREASLEGLVAAIVALFGTGASATAYHHTNKQIKEGTIDPLESKEFPPPPHPADVVVAGMQGINEIQKQLNEGLGKINDLAAASGIPLPQLGIPNIIPATLPGITATAGMPQPPMPSNSLAAQAIEASRR